MQVAANNVANADTTETPEGGPYKRQQIVFSTVMDEMNGVKVEGTFPSNEPPRRVFNPSHPDADKEGFVAMPNVQVPVEMVDMLTASRAYEANLAAISKFRQIVEEAIKLIRPT